ncbi:hypothetical protein BN2476_470109 [Paraburkholderia piptadeniae]|uniref:Uncharacterized protein n=1 Tax=Paraburkholderia piptadeniae TaxID=1701573 RepID=A0A1N7SEB7_9BURK|nr:hypothetical protein BN2476_470109 [Paraburkholderia piptadeniae]
MHFVLDISRHLHQSNFHNLLGTHVNEEICSVHRGLGDRNLRLREGLVHRPVRCRCELPSV